MMIVISIVTMVRMLVFVIVCVVAIVVIMAILISLVVAALAPPRPTGAFRRELPGADNGDGFHFMPRADDRGLDW